MSDSQISLMQPPEGYGDWLAGLKQRIHTAQQRATLAVNRELVLPCWQIVQQAVGLLLWGHNLFLLCKSKNRVVAEYALGDKTQPMGIAEYKLRESLPESLETSLPSIEQIERELQGGEK